MTLQKANRQQNGHSGLKTTFLLAFILANAIATQAQQSGDSFYLHKFAQNIGKEVYHLNQDGNTNTYDIDFKFVDRGSPVPLKATLITTKDKEPLSLIIKGSTSRFSTVDDSIVISDKKISLRVDDSVYSSPLKPGSFPVAGYSPGTVQMALLQYWKKHKEPSGIYMLPKGEVKISRKGKDTFSFMGNPVILDRFVISGIVWGNELVWTDKADHLVCLITNDAEGDKLEMLQTNFESLLPEFLSLAARYGMELFSADMKMTMKKNSILAVTGGNLVDVETNQTIKNAVVVIENGLIKQAGKSGEVKIPAGARIIHAEGKTILPGLWDMHAHFQQAEWGPAYLAAGVTTVRDCGNEFVYINAVKAAIDAHKGVGPFIIKAGIIDGPGPMGLGIVRATTAVEAINAVDMYKANGFAQVKIYSSVTPDIVKVIAAEAHRLGLTVTGHIPNNMSTKAGIDSGMDQVNHMQYIYGMMKRNKDKTVDMKDSANMAMLDYLKLHGTVVDPTMGVFEMIFRNVKDNILEMEPNFYSLPLPLQSLFSNTGMPPEQATSLKPRFQSMLSMVKALYDKGIPVVAGTDMGFPGFSLARELELYVEAGLTPMQAIQSASIVPARVMGMEQQTGSVNAGKNADLVIIDGDPLGNIRDIRKVSMVIKEGQLYDPVALHKMVGFK